MQASALATMIPSLPTADHCCGWLASGDRDGKLRVVSTQHSRKGAWEICAYCMGHKACITWVGCMTLVPSRCSSPVAELMAS
jgi:hypothetical protein